MIPKKIDLPNPKSTKHMALYKSFNQLVEHLSQHEVKEEWPKKGDRYWIVDSSGAVLDIYFENDSTDDDYKSFGNVFRTKEAAEAARDKIKELLKGI